MTTKLDAPRRNEQPQCGEALSMFWVDTAFLAVRIGFKLLDVPRRSSVSVLLGTHNVGINVESVYVERHR